MKLILVIAFLSVCVQSIGSFTGSCTASTDSCPPGCTCSSSCEATCTYPPTHSPTATPTATPTSPSGRCCGVNPDTGANFCFVVDEDDCNVPAPAPRRAAPAEFLDTLKNRRNVDAVTVQGAVSWDAGLNCQSACGTGVPVGASTSESGSANFTLNVAAAGLGDNGGVALTPVEPDDVEEATNGLTLPNGDVILAFDIKRYAGAMEMRSDWLQIGSYIAVIVQSEDPIFTQDIVDQLTLWRLDEFDGWVDNADECGGRYSAPATTTPMLYGNTNPPSVIFYICHTTPFAITVDGADSKDTKSKGKKVKAPSASKESKAKSKGKKAKAGKKASASSAIALGVGIGGGVVALLAGGCVVKRCTGKQQNNKGKNTQRPAKRAAAEVVVPAGAMTV